MEMKEVLVQGTMVSQPIQVTFAVYEVCVCVCVCVCMRECNLHVCGERMVTVEGTGDSYVLFCSQHCMAHYVRHAMLLR